MQCQVRGERRECVRKDWEGYEEGVYRQLRFQSVWEVGEDEDKDFEAQEQVLREMITFFNKQSHPYPSKLHSLLKLKKFANISSKTALFLSLNPESSDLLSGKHLSLKQL